MKYQVVRIDEDIDFGCEERSAARRGVVLRCIEQGFKAVP